jgi:hypothetical protein
MANRGEMPRLPGERVAPGDASRFCRSWRKGRTWEGVAPRNLAYLKLCTLHLFLPSPVQ